MVPLPSRSTSSNTCWISALDMSLVQSVVGDACSADRAESGGRNLVAWVAPMMGEIMPRLRLGTIAAGANAETLDARARKAAAAPSP